MKWLQNIFPVFILSFVFLDLQAQEDSVMYQRDSAIIPEWSPTVLFFQQHEKISRPSEVRLVTKTNRIVKLQHFLDSIGIYSDHTLADLDQDGKKELLVSNYTVGAHCCDEIYIFRNIAPNRFQHAAKLFAGNTLVMPNNEFVYDFHEQFGYFFTCFACDYTDTSDAAPIRNQTINLKYVKGKMKVVPGDKELRSTILDNLGKLGEQPYEKLDDPSMFDNGLRKEFALNLAVFHFSFGKNILETQKLFNKFYKYPDAKKVWNAFVKQLQYMKKENDF